MPGFIDLPLFDDPDAPAPGSSASAPASGAASVRIGSRRRRREPSSPTVRVRLDVAYDGSGFRGFAENRGVTTVGGRLADALEQVLGHQVSITCAGRTDAGVHARGQVVTLDVEAARFDPTRLVRSLGRLCGPEIVVTGVAVVADDFDARHSATARRYRYQIHNAPAADPLIRHAAWHVPRPLDRSLLRLGCDPLIGEHDFTSFCRIPKGADGSVSMVRRVQDARWEEGPDGLLWFWIEANAFCHQMVRSIVGTLVEVGEGRRRPGDLLGTIAARDRHAAGRMAPAHGLTLWSVTY